MDIHFESKDILVISVFMLISFNFFSVYVSAYCSWCQDECHDLRGNENYNCCGYNEDCGEPSYKACWWACYCFLHPQKDECQNPATGDIGADDDGEGGCCEEFSVYTGEKGCPEGEACVISNGVCKSGWSCGPLDFSLVKERKPVPECECGDVKIEISPNPPEKEEEMTISVSSDKPLQWVVITIDDGDPMGIESDEDMAIECKNDECTYYWMWKFRPTKESHKITFYCGAENNDISKATKCNSLTFNTLSPECGERPTIEFEPENPKIREEMTITVLSTTGYTNVVLEIKKEDKTVVMDNLKEKHYSWEWIFTPEESGRYSVNFYINCEDTDVEKCILCTTGEFDVSEKSQKQLISECRVIDTPGDYRLTEDIKLSSEESSEEMPYCIKIESSDVTLDCKEYNENSEEKHKITGNGNGIGIYIYSEDSDNKIENVKVKNCEISNFNTGIEIIIGQSNTIENNIIHSNEFGIIINGQNNEVLNNIIHSNFRGIYVDPYSNNNIISENILSTNKYLDIIINSEQNQKSKNNKCDKGKCYQSGEYHICKDKEGKDKEGYGDCPLINGLKVFVTSEICNGNLPECLLGMVTEEEKGNIETEINKKEYSEKGLYTADKICQYLAKKSEYIKPWEHKKGEFKAWLSTTKIDARDRFNNARLEKEDQLHYERVDGKKVADSFDDLVDCNPDNENNKKCKPNDENNNCLKNPIQLTEKSEELNEVENKEVFTNTLCNGLKASEDISETCNDYTSIGPIGNFYKSSIGNLSATDDKWTTMNVGNCNNNYRLYCFQDVDEGEKGLMVFLHYQHNQLSPNQENIYYIENCAKGIWIATGPGIPIKIKSISKTPELSLTPLNQGNIIVRALCTDPLTLKVVMTRVV